MDPVASHRRPPRPPFEASSDGVCRLCGEGVSEGKARRWHKACLVRWLVASDPRYARTFLHLRDHGVCAGCGSQDDRVEGAWHVDHKLRLADRPREIAFWLPTNLQTLCLTCHFRKTAEENRRPVPERNVP